MRRTPESHDPLDGPYFLARDLSPSAVELVGHLWSVLPDPSGGAVAIEFRLRTGRRIGRMTAFRHRPPGLGKRNLKYPREFTYPGKGL